MDSWLVGAALLSALLHATWNAAVKASPQPATAMTAQMLASAGLAFPALIWTGMPAAASWPWMAASTLLSIGAIFCLLRAYDQARFGIVYPIARSSSVLLVLPMAAAVAGEWPTPLGVLGVGLVSCAVMLLALGSSNERPMTRPAMLWTLAAGTFTAGYVVCDAVGVRQSASPLAYGCALSVANAAVWTWLNRRAHLLHGAMAVPWQRSLPTAVAAMASYLLILWVWTRAPIALASALRDTSAVFATVIAVTLLKEPIDRRVLLAVALATAGSITIRLG